MVRIHLAISLLLASLSAWAGADVCREPAAHAELSIAAVNHDTGGLAPPPGRTRQQDRGLDVLLRGPGSRLAAGFGHRYVAFDFDGLAPQTNAHLHTSLFPLHWIDAGDPGSFRVSIAPALSASSNIVGHPQAYRGDSLQLLAGLAWRRTLSETATARYAICGDHIFGDFRIYPSLGIEWQPHPDWTLDLGYPFSRIGYRIGDRWSASLRATPDGNEWQVTDRNFREESRFVFKAYALDWQLAWQVLPKLAVSLSLGTQLDARYELTLQDGERVRLHAGTVLRAGAGLRWRF